MNNFILNMLGKQPIEVIYNMLIKSNPQLKQTVEQWQNMAHSNNMSPEQFARQMLKQQGVPESVLNSFLSKMK